MEDEITIFNHTYDVVNLGCSGHDPYDSYFRLKYFEKALNLSTEQVILIVNSDNQSWFERHPKPLSFEIPRSFGEKNQDRMVNLQIKLRNMSSLVNLYVNGLLKADDEPKDEPEHTDINEHKTIPNEVKQPIAWLRNQDCLLAFNNEYNDFLKLCQYLKVKRLTVLT